MLVVSIVLQNHFTDHSFVSSFLLSLPLSPLKGDSPLIGCGADNNIGGVSTTGHGESLMRVKACRRVMERLERGVDANNAAQEVLDFMLEKCEGGRGGIIVVTPESAGIAYSTVKMAWAFCSDEETILSGISPGD